MEKELRNLPVKLNPEEVAAKAQELVDRIKVRNETVESLAEVSRTLKENIKKLKFEIERLARCVRDKIEYRDVECIELRNEKNMTIETVRCDLHEIVCTRLMSLNEKQIAMFPEKRLEVVSGDKAESTSNE